MKGKNRISKLITIIVLVIGIVAITIGFAAFSTTLTIKSGADVEYDSTELNVVFSTSSVTVSNGTVSGTVSGVSGASADVATLASKQVSGINAHFTKPGQTVSYVFFVHNNSSFSAHAFLLNNLQQCIPDNSHGSPATQGLNAACSDISRSIFVNDSAVVANFDLDPGDVKKIEVVIQYSNGGHIADGDFFVTFDDIELSYSTEAEGGAILD